MNAVIGRSSVVGEAGLEVIRAAGFTTGVLQAVARKALDTPQKRQLAVIAANAAVMGLAIKNHVDRGLPRTTKEYFTEALGVRGGARRMKQDAVLSAVAIAVNALLNR